MHTWLRPFRRSGLVVRWRISPFQFSFETWNQEFSSSFRTFLKGTLQSNQFILIIVISKSEDEHTRWSSWWSRASTPPCPRWWWTSVLPCRASGGVPVIGLFSGWCTWYPFHSFFRWRRTRGAAARWWSRAWAPPAGCKPIFNFKCIFSPPYLSAQEKVQRNFL